MITRENLSKVLEIVGFENNNGVYTKKYHDNAFIQVDFCKETIDYAPLDTSFKNGEYPNRDKGSSGFIVHRNTIGNFSSNENFVCLLAIDRLLDKGYKPKHIVIEPTFKVGHNQQVYGDILILDENYENLILIENKTYGPEFSKEWNNTIKNGGQLFSYHAVNQSKFLCLLTYDFDQKTEAVFYKTHIISMKDNEKYLKTLEINQTKSKQTGFASAKNAKEYHQVWSEIYSLSYTPRGLLEEDIQTYRIGKEKYTVSDLIVVPYSDIRSIYHEFSTILRNNAIGNYENTFYILVDLFLCKIVDEIYNSDDLKFYWKGVAYDDPLDYCDRLLTLYEKGIKEFFQREVININHNTIEDIFVEHGRYKGKLKEEIEEIFKKQKFYNIKKFNFIEVENEEEFNFNFRILIQITNLIQDFHISKSENNQFLGDLFEGFLNRSVHQTEGRFFTPMPITNFIIRSLPEPEPKSKILDFACGAGHFLTEYLEHYHDLRVYGIEKNKELSKVARIACTFHNQQNAEDKINIIFQDALLPIKTALSQKFEDGSFDIIVSNPPYAVKGFLNQIDNKRIDHFWLAKNIDKKAYETNSSIECFFIERAINFLKDGGYLALILPISILQKANIYHETRKLIINHLEILSIVELNKRTFGSTGIKTVILIAKKQKKNGRDLINFLKLKEYNDDCLKNEFLDTEILKDYCNFMSYPYLDFKKFMKENIVSIILENTETFKNYFDDYRSEQPKYFKRKKITPSQNKIFFQEYCSKTGKKPTLKEYLASNAYKEKTMLYYYNLFVEDVKKIEIEKMELFANIHSNDLILIKSPPEKNKNDKSNITEILKFLGYDWSKRKGDEGIKYNIGTQKHNTDNKDNSDSDEETLSNINSIKYIETPLYNPQNKNDKTKLNYIIKKFIESKNNGSLFNSTEELKDFFLNDPNSFSVTTQKLIDMIDFRKAYFSNLIDLNEKIECFFPSSKYPYKKIGESITKHEPSKIQVEEIKNTNIGKYPFFTSGSNIYNCDHYLVEGKNIFLSTGGNANIYYYEGKSSYSADTYAFQSINEEKILTQYIFIILYRNINLINRFFRGAGLEHLQKEQFHDVKIPIPPLGIQKKLIEQHETIKSRCSEIDNYLSFVKQLSSSLILQFNIGMKKEDNISSKKLDSLIDEINTFLKKRMATPNKSFDKKKIHSLIQSLSSCQYEEMKLANIGKICMCRRVLKSQRSNSGEIPFYKIGTLGEDPDEFIDTKLFNEYKNKSPYPKKGDILLSTSGTLGKSIAFDGSPAYFQDSNIVWIDNDQVRVLNDYLYLLYTKVIDWDKFGTDGGNIKRLYNENLKDIKILAPSTEIQTKIVNIFKEITELESCLTQEKKELKNQERDMLDKFLYEQSKENLIEQL